MKAKNFSTIRKQLKKKNNISTSFCESPKNVWQKSVKYNNFEKISLKSCCCDGHKKQNYILTFLGKTQFSAMFGYTVFVQIGEMLDQIRSLKN